MSQSMDAVLEPGGRRPAALHYGARAPAHPAPPIVCPEPPPLSGGMSQSMDAGLEHYRRREVRRWLTALGLVAAIGAVGVLQLRREASRTAQQPAAAGETPPSGAPAR